MAQQRIALDTLGQDIGRRPTGPLSWAIALKKFMVRRPLGAFGLIVLTIFVFAAVFASYLTPYDVNQRNSAVVLQAPSLSHVLGTDQLGRDVLTRILYGARLSMTVGLVVSFTSAFIGLTLGVIAGFYGGKVDRIAIVLLDSMMAFPGLILAIALVAALGPSLTNVIIALLVGSFSRKARVVRAGVLSVRSTTYVEGARAVGCGDLRLMALYIVPNVMATIIVLTSLSFAAAMLAESSLSFLGLGPPPPTPTWGRMLSDEGRAFFRSAPWLVIWPGLSLTFAVYALNLLGDALRDHLDPRLRGS